MTDREKLIGLLHNIDELDINFSYGQCGIIADYLLNEGLIFKETVKQLLLNYLIEGSEENG